VLGLVGSASITVPPAVAATTGVARLAGGDRLATAIQISSTTFPKAQSASAVVLTASDDFPDALAGAPLAAAKGAPLLLTDPGTLSGPTLLEIRRVALPGATVYILGGPGAVSPTIDQQLNNAGYATGRVAGLDRFDTSVKIAEALGSPTTVLLARGDNFADALSAGAAAASVHGAVLLTAGASLPPSVGLYLAGLPQPTIYDIGAAAGAAYPPGTHIAGGDRFITSALVAQRFFPSPSIVGIATGYNFPDALAGAAAMGTIGGPVLLSDPSVLPPGVDYYLGLHASTISTAFLFGGVASLSDSVELDVSAALKG
jgi:putative cell wall-binding protein